MHPIRSLKRRTALFLVNHVLTGTRPCFFETKRRWLNSIGYSIGEGTKVVGPMECYAKLKVGRNCWLGKNLKINGNGTVEIGDNCDIGPEVTFQTGGHQIGTSERRAGEGLVFHQKVGNGVWIGGRITILGNTTIGSGSVVAGCACVVKDVPPNTLVGGVLAKMIRKLDDEDSEDPEK